MAAATEVKGEAREVLFRFGDGREGFSIDVAATPSGDLLEQRVRALVGESFDAGSTFGRLQFADDGGGSNRGEFLLTAT